MSYWGNAFNAIRDSQTVPPDGERVSGNIRVSFRVTVKKGGFIKQIDFKGVPSITGILRVGLQSDAGGIPSGTWLTYGEIDLADTSFSDNGYMWKVPMNTPHYEVTAGQLVHIVFEPIGSTSIQIFTMQPNNKIQPYEPWRDENMACLLSRNAGASWSEVYPTRCYETDINWPFEPLCGLSPIYVIVYDRLDEYGINVVEGQSFVSCYDGFYVFEGNYQGQMIKPPFDVTFNAVAFRVGREGLPPNPLIMDIYEVDSINATQILDTLLTDFVFANSSDIPELGWTAPFREVSTPEITLQAGRIYQIIFRTVGGATGKHGGGSGPCYHILTEGAFGPLEGGSTQNDTAERRRQCYRERLNFLGDDSAAVMGSSIPLNATWYPDDHPFYLRLVTGVQRSLHVKSSPVDGVPVYVGGVRRGTTPWTGQVNEGTRIIGAEDEVITE